MNVNPGDFNKKITIFSEIKTKDADNFDVVTETVIREPNASFNRISGTEKVKAGLEVGTTTARFLIRKKAGVNITKKMKIRYASDVYNIKFVNDYQDSHEYEEILAELIEL